MIGYILHFIVYTLKEGLYVFLCILLTTYYLVLKCRRNPRLIKFAKTIPGSDGLPLVGNSLQFAFRKLDALPKVLASYSEQYGSIYKLWLGRELVIGLADVDHLETIFRSLKTLGKPKTLFSGFEEFWGNAMFTCPVSVWRQVRKKLQPVFSRNVTKFHINSFNESVNKLVKLFENHVNGPEFNVKEYCAYTATDAFLSSYYDLHLSLKETEYFSLHTILNELSKDSLHKMINPWRRINFLNKLYVGDKLDNFKDRLRKFFVLLKEKIIILEEDDHLDQKRPEKIAKSLFFLIQHQEKEMKLENYSFEENMDMISVSTDTTSTLTSFCLLMIAMHPEIQKKLYEEIRQVFGNDESPATMEALDKCTYLHQVMKETLRRFTITPNIFRYVDENTEVGSMVIPAGVTVMVRIRDIHMNPHIYPNPEEFNPDNFSPEAVSQRSKFSFLPFSMGIRDCIGKIFAESIAKLTIIALLRKFHLSTTTKMEDLQYEIGFTVAKRGGYWLSLTPRY